MKVIEQLIQHFHARGVLSATEIDYLLAAGYIRRHDLFGHPPADDEPNLTAWKTGRGSSGRMVPQGFPRPTRFG